MIGVRQYPPAKPNKVSRCTEWSDPLTGEYRPGAPECGCCSQRYVTPIKTVRPKRGWYRPPGTTLPNRGVSNVDFTRPLPHRVGPPEYPVQRPDCTRVYGYSLVNGKRVWNLCPGSQWLS